MKESYIKGSPIPESVGRTADLYAEVRELRLAMESEVNDVRARETELRESIIERLSSSDDTGASGLRYRAQIKKKTKPKPADWEKIYDYIVKHDRFDFLQKRLSDKAVMDVMEEEGSVPGVEKIHIPDVSITKVK